MQTDDAVILVPPAKPKEAATCRATGAGMDGDTLVVSVKGGGPVAVPAGAAIYCNGVLNAAANVPAWFAFHASETVRVNLVNERRLAKGEAAVPPVPPVYFTLADTDEGVVARFDQR